MNSESTDAVDREIERRVKDAYATLEVPKHVEDRIRAMVETQGRTDTPAAPRLRVTAWVVSCGAVMALSLVVAILALLGQPVPNQSPVYVHTTDPTRNSLSRDEAFVNEFATFVASGRTADISSTDPRVLQKWFMARLENVTPPDPPSESRLRLAGGRICQIKRDRVVSYVYQMDSTLVSLYMNYVKPTDADTPAAGDSELSISFRNSYGYATWIQQGWRFSLVGKLPSEQFADIAVTMSHPQKDNQS